MGSIEEETRQWSSVPVCALSFEKYFRSDLEKAKNILRNLPGETTRNKLVPVVEKQRKIYVCPSYDDLVKLSPQDLDSPTDYRLCELFLMVPVMWQGIWVKNRKTRGSFLIYRTYEAAVARSVGSGESLSRFLLREYLGRPLKRSEGAAFRDGNPFNLSPENMILTTISGRPMACVWCRKPTTRDESELILKKILPFMPEASIVSLIPETLDECDKRLILFS